MWHRGLEELPSEDVGSSNNAVTDHCIHTYTCTPTFEWGLCDDEASLAKGISTWYN